MSKNLLILKKEITSNKNTGSSIPWVKLILVTLFLFIIAYAIYYFHSCECDHNTDITISFNDTVNNVSDKFVNIGKYLIPLSRDDNNKFMQTKLVIKLQNHYDKELVQAKIYDIKDIVYGFLKDIRYSDLNDTSGFIMMKVELLKRINIILAPQFIDEVLIQEFTVHKEK